MFTDARDLPDNTRIDADLAIVGGGPAGITLARAFAKTATRVCLVESGGLELEPEVQALYEGENTGIIRGDSVMGKVEKRGQAYTFDNFNPSSNFLIFLLRVASLEIFKVKRLVAWDTADSVIPKCSPISFSVLPLYL